MQLEFTKMHGLGNDFVVIETIHQTVSLSVEQYQFIANRHFGVGCDQILLVEASKQKNVDFKYRIFNADGSEVEQCGNGVRCLARFVRDKGLCEKEEIIVETLSGIVRVQVQADAQVTVNMGSPDFTPESLPFIADQQASLYPLQLPDELIEIHAVSIGNPHAVLRVPDTNEADVARLGPLIQSHTRFPQHVNAGFMQVIDKDHIRLRVFERGSGETLACGTGACAAMVVGRQQGWLNDTVTVSLPGGDLSVSWTRGDIMMTGPAESVYEGMIKL